MDVKELYQEIILDHGRILEIKINVRITIKMPKDTIHYVEIKFMFF